MLDLIEEILPLLPPPGANDPPELLFHFSNADGPSYQAHHEVLQGSMDLARQGRSGWRAGVHGRCLGTLTPCAQRSMGAESPRTA